MRFYGQAIDPGKLPGHIAIIMDGNGRWAKKRGLERVRGHEKGFQVLKEIIDFNKHVGVKTISVFAFSTENWKRPEGEVGFLMQLAANLVREYVDELLRNNVRLTITGSEEHLDPALIELLKEGVDRTKDCTAYTLNIAFNYGGKKEIVDAARRIAEAHRGKELDLKNFGEKEFGKFLYHPELPDVDLLIRTSGELRISNFLLWQSAYAEFWFTDKFWPDFTRKDFCRAIRDFQRRKRRKGGI
jgi:undecaprenyl diphosphate synthase